MRQVIVSSTVSLFALTVHMIKFDMIELSNQILFISMLQIWNLMYFRYFWIIKCMGLDMIFLLLTWILFHPLKFLIDFVVLLIIFLT